MADIDAGEFQKSREDIYLLKQQVHSNTVMIEQLYPAVFGQEKPQVVGIANQVAAVVAYVENKKREDSYLKWMGAGVLIFSAGNLVLLLFIATHLK